MEVTKFNAKLNKVEGNIYVIEETVQLTNGMYEAELKHDNINDTTFAVYTGPKLTGDRIDTYTLSTPSLMPWKRIVRVYADVSLVYLSYETEGDTVEAVDVNELQEAVVVTQEALNTEEARASAAEQQLASDLTAEADRAMAAEQKLADGLEDETARASEAERVLTVNLDTETKRAIAAENKLTDDLKVESDRAKQKEGQIESALTEETGRAKAAEQANAAAIKAEENRATEAEGTLTTNLSAEVTRAKAAEKANADNLSAEVIRAKKAESDINTALTSEVSRAKAKETEIENTMTANKQETDQELANRYTKDKVYTKEEVLSRIEELIGAAPEALDTLKEIADALGNDPNFATTMITLLGGKVDKEPGKGLSESDYTAEEKAKLAGLPETMDPSTQANWQASDPDDPAFIKNKPTGLSAFENDAGYLQGGVMTWGDLMGGGG